VEARVHARGGAHCGRRGGEVPMLVPARVKNERTGRGGGAVDAANSLGSGAALAAGFLRALGRSAPW
jgi:hypothetical protein